MNKLLLRAIVKTLRAGAECIEDYSYTYRHEDGNTTKNVESLQKAAKLVRQACIHINGILED